MLRPVLNAKSKEGEDVNLVQNLFNIEFEAT